MTRLCTIIAVVIALVPAAAWGQSSIELRSSARMTPGTPVTLAQIATLKGGDAIALAGIVIVPAGQGPSSKSASPITLTVDHVRSAIDGEQRVNWGRVTLRGSRCVVLPAESQAAAPPPARAEPERSTSVEPGTVRAAAIRRLEQLTATPADRLRATFDAKDATLLDMSTAGRTIEINATATSDRLPLAIRVYERDRTVAEATIRVNVEVEREVVRTSRALRRGETIDADDVTQEAAWTPLTTRPAEAGRVVGSVTKDRIDEGHVLTDDDLAAALAVQRGELVSVRVVSGSVVVQTKARAMASARDGEFVRLRALDSPREFTARMDGRGRAVIMARETPFDVEIQAKPARSVARHERSTR